MTEDINLAEKSRKVAQELTAFFKSKNISADIACDACLMVVVSTCLILDMEETDVRDIFKEALANYVRARENRIIEKLQ